MQLPGVEWRKCDLLDIYAVQEVMEGITSVYHCAAIVSFHKKQQAQMLHFNTESTAVLVNEALERGVEKLVHISSVAALGRSEKAKPEINEDEEWEESKHNSAYGLSKYMAEMEVWRGIGEGLNAVILNPSVILGTGDWNSGSAALMKVAYSEFPFYTNGITGWVDVEDVTRAAVMLMQSDVSNERFIINGVNLSFRDVFTKMATSLGKKAPGIYANKFLTALTVFYGKLQVLAGKTPVITPETARTAHAVSRYSSGKLNASFPLFQYTSIDATISRIAADYLKQSR
jgi:nucleoside-diphosphate-sugar epimerase